jgi:hypothetical protein
MHGSELPPLADPPISITCDVCRNEMRLASIDPTNEKAVYAYECVDGHRRQFSTTDPASIGGLATTRDGPAPARPSEIPNGVRNNILPLSTVVQREWPSIYLARVLRAR